MPKTRGSVVASAAPLRASPRKKRKVADTPISSSPTQNELEEDDASESEIEVKPTKRGGRNASTKTESTTTNSAVANSKSKPKQQTKTTGGAPDAIPEATAKNTQINGKRKWGNDTTLDSTKEVGEGVSDLSSKKPVSNSKKSTVKPDEPEKAEKIVRKRKTKEEKEAEAMPLAPRSTGLKMFVGAHVSIAKGVENAITNALYVGGNAFALFLKSQRKWDNPALKDENRIAFKQQCTHHHYDQSSHVVPHGSYLVNLATPDKDAAKKSYDAFLDDLRRCEAMGIKYYNFHPGTTNKEPLDEAIGRLAGNLNRALAETSTVVPLLENMAGRGSVIGARFSDLRDIIAQIKPEYKSRIGICIDTCHTFAAGYDLRSPEAFKKTFQELDETVGLQYLKAMHINDSKAPLDSHRDLHQNIGVGFLGLRAFHNVMNDPRLQDIPLILETPSEKPDPNNPKKTIDDKNVYAREIKLLESLIGMDPEGAEFKKLESDLSALGKAERDKVQNSIVEKEEKARRKAQKELEKGQKSISNMFGGRAKKRKGSVSSTSSLSEVDSD